MARPREFEPNEALNQAMYVFWRKGYEDTSMADLVETTGVSRYGFYNEFGDKHDLFLKCIDHYTETAINMILAPMERPTASLPEIRGYFNQLLQDVSGNQPPMGCLIGNASVSSLEWDTAVSSRINHHFTRMRAAFLNALQNAAQQGELDNRQDVEALADYLVGVANGYLAGVRSMTPEAVRQYIQISLAQLEKRP
jgi:TetR/AcrR family transcriptional repressor of nem operon